MLRRDTRHLDAGDCRGLPPVQFGDRPPEGGSSTITRSRSVASGLSRKKPSETQRRNVRGRLAKQPQGRRLEVIVMIVTDQYEIYGWQIRRPQGRRAHARRAQKA